jgi:23S rRNA maturation mini-RNase III
MNNWNEQEIEMIRRCRNAEKGTTSRAGSLLVSKSPASVNSIDRVKVIADLLNAKRY